MPVLTFINDIADFSAVILLPFTLKGIAEHIIKTDRDYAVVAHVKESHPYKLKHCGVNQCASLT